jgi:ubiquinone/menaquinone biosynthesis C-methylase UbiE
VKKTEGLIRSARGQFNRELHTEEYRRIHSDDDQLRALIELLQVQSGDEYLDLGTGGGYVAFEIARQCPGCNVTGIDIADAAIAANLEQTEAAGVANLDFRTYSGTVLPFDDASFGGVISRYAFHHFPEPELSVSELHRVLRQDGRVIISDPVCLDADTEDFINAFQRLKPDGHVRFYRPAELSELFSRHGLQRLGRFTTRISYPREMDSRYEQLLERTPATILESYQVEVSGSQVFVSVDIANSLFQKE